MGKPSGGQDEERGGLRERERQARGEAERRAEEEAALRQATAAVASAFTAEEAVRRIAECALQATRADGAFVKRLDLEHGQVAVAAVAGEVTPPLGASAPYENSWTELVLEREQPLLVHRVSENGRALPEGLDKTCGDCSAAVVPLIDAGEPIGALILLRKPERQAFRHDEVQRAYTFGDLAALAFRKIHLLEDSERRREELERVMESRARLMRGFSHDVKNPLGAAVGYLQVMAEGALGALTPAQQEGIGRVRRSLDSALGLIASLLELAHAEAGHIEIELSPTDVRQAVREMTEEYRAQAEAKDLTLTVQLPDEFPLTTSDPSRVRQILGNLLSNAVKYTPAGGEITVRVSIESTRLDQRIGQWVRVDVSDTGPGIPEDKQHLLFEEFARLDPTSGHGAGVGLAISQRVAHALGGRITLDSEAGRGSTFTLWVPCTSKTHPDQPDTPCTTNEAG
jgi:signal transduction histidine kinase